MRAKNLFAVILASAAFLTAGLVSGCGETHEHTLRHVDAEQPGCEEQGNLEYWVCDECGKYFSDEAATQEIVSEDIMLPARHQLEYCEAVTADGVFSCDSKAHYVCTACGKYFSDEAALQEMSESDVFMTKTFELTDASITDTSTDRTTPFYAIYNGESIELAVTEPTFVLRVFLGWEGAEYTDLMQGDGARVNVNIDTEENLANGKWASFHIGCDRRGGYAYFKNETKCDFSIIMGGGKLTEALKENSGLYITLVRDGGTFTAYAEDLEGNYVYLAESESFSDSALVKCTFGVHKGYYASEEHPAVLKDGVLVIGTTDPAAAKG